MDVQHTLPLASIHMSLSEVCSDNPSQSRLTEAEQVAFYSFLPVHLLREASVAVLRAGCVDFYRDVCFRASSREAACVDGAPGGERADAALAMTGPRKLSFQVALITLSVAQLTAGTLFSSLWSNLFTSLETLLFPNALRSLWKVLVNCRTDLLNQPCCLFLRGCFHIVRVMSSNTMNEWMNSSTLFTILKL